MVCNKEWVMMACDGAYSNYGKPGAAHWAFLFRRSCDPVPRNAPARDDYHQKIKRSLLKPNISKHDL